MVTERLDRFQRKHPRAAFPLVVAYKYFDDFGAYLGTLFTYYGFVSLSPLLLLLLVSDRRGSGPAEASSAARSA